MKQIHQIKSIDLDTVKTTASHYSNEVKKFLSEKTTLPANGPAIAAIEGLIYGYMIPFVSIRAASVLPAMFDFAINTLAGGAFNIHSQDGYFDFVSENLDYRKTAVVLGAATGLGLWARGGLASAPAKKSDAAVEDTIAVHAAPAMPGRML